jgi:hypothetical protein
MTTKAPLLSSLASAKDLREAMELFLPFTDTLLSLALLAEIKPVAQPGRFGLTIHATRRAALKPQKDAV